MQIVTLYNEISSSHREKIEEFLMQEKHASIFQTHEMFNIYKRVKKQESIFIIAIEEDEVVGLLLAIIQKEHKGFIGIFSSRSIIVGGPIVKNNNISTLRVILEVYVKNVRKQIIYSQFRNFRLFSNEEKKVFDDFGIIYESHLDIIHDLTKSVNDQWMALHKGRRKNIRRAENAGVVFKEVDNENDFEIAYSLVKSTYNRIKLPIPHKSLFLESYHRLSGSGILKTFVAEFNNVIIGARMVLCYNNMIYDWYAGANDKHLDKYPNDFLPWKIIEWGSLNEFRYFDFGGAGKPDIPYGVRDHKLKFGGQLVEYGRFEKVHNKIVYSLGKLGMKIYKKRLCFRIM